jgi:hypothetical protein
LTTVPEQADRLLDEGMYNEMNRTGGGKSHKSDVGPTPGAPATDTPVVGIVTIEKYLQVSDFISYILDNKDLFLEEELKGVRTKDEEQNVVMTLLIKFMLEV